MESFVWRKIQDSEEVVFTVIKAGIFAQNLRKIEFWRVLHKLQVHLSRLNEETERVKIIRKVLLCFLAWLKSLFYLACFIYFITWNARFSNITKISLHWHRMRHFNGFTVEKKLEYSAKSNLYNLVTTTISHSQMEECYPGVWFLFYISV